MSPILRTSAIILAVAGLAGCAAHGTALLSQPSPAPQHRAYNGTASVGDFLTLTLDASTHTLTYVDRSNGDSGTIGYSVNPDGTYTLNDPSGNLVAAYEVPGYALIIEAEKTGPNHDTPSLVTAVESGQISPATFASRSYNYMQFRTAAGGIEVGYATLDAQDDSSGASYWPFGAMNGSSQFNTLQGISGSSMVLDASGTFFTIPDLSGSDYVFGTANGLFAVDTPNGAILGLRQAASKAFDPSVAGTYKAIYYEKTGAQNGPGNVETGTASLSSGTIVIGADGHVALRDASKAELAAGTLLPVADVGYLVGPGELTNPCFGLFTFRVTTSSSQEDVFVSFQGRALLFSGFTAPVPAPPGSTYDYLYGVGLH